MDGQTAEITVPSVGNIKVRVIASDYCHLKGLHGIPVLGLGVLPWDEKPLERREVVTITNTILQIVEVNRNSTAL